jgi:hypothetical protein
MKLVRPATYAPLDKPIYPQSSQSTYGGFLTAVFLLIGEIVEEKKREGKRR